VNQKQADQIVEEMRARYPWLSWSTYTMLAGTRIVVLGNGWRGCQEARIEITRHHPGNVFRAEIKMYDPSALVRLVRYGNGPTAAEAVSSAFDRGDNFLDDAEAWRAWCVDELRAKADELRSDLADAESALRGLGAGAEE
jgi:hypothetical protein